MKKPEEPKPLCVLHYSNGVPYWIKGYMTVVNTKKKKVTRQSGRVAIVGLSGGLLTYDRHLVKPESEVVNPSTFAEVFGGYVVAAKTLEAIHQRHSDQWSQLAA